MGDSLALAKAIYAYIKTQSDPVSMTYIMDRSRAKGNGDLETIEALEKLHRIKDIQKTVKDNEAYYRYVPYTPPKDTLVPERVIYTKEDNEIWDTLWQECPFITDEEKQCANVPYNQRTDRCHEVLLTSAGFKHVMIKKYGEAKWKRMCDEKI